MKRMRKCNDEIYQLAKDQALVIDHNPSWKENQRHKRESFVMRELQTLHPEGINKLA
jgi:hypothetical protein